MTTGHSNPHNIQQFVLNSPKNDTHRQLTVSNTYNTYKLVSATPNAAFRVDPFGTWFLLFGRRR